MSTNKDNGYLYAMAAAVAVAVLLIAVLDKMAWEQSHE